MSWSWLALMVMCGLFEVYRIRCLWREVERRTAVGGKPLGDIVSELRSEIDLLSLSQSAMQQALENMYVELREARQEVDMLLQQRPPGSQRPKRPDLTAEGT